MGNTAQNTLASAYPSDMVSGQGSTLQTGGENVAETTSKSQLLRMALGISVISASVVMFEVALTRIFSFSLWSHLAFLVVSTALFGFGLSGVFLSLQKNHSRFRSLSGPALLYCIAILVSYAVINLVPFELFSTNTNWRYFLNLGIWYVALVLPFFFAGIVIASILSESKKHSPVLYGLDLLGAAMGALAFIPLIGHLNAEGTVFAAAAMGAFAGLVLARNELKAKFTALMLLIGLLGASPVASKYFPIQMQQKKRRFAEAVEKKQIIKTKWSTLSRVDIAEHRKLYFRTPFKIRAVWIDGGTNESGAINLPPDWESTLPPQTFSSVATVHQLKLGTSPNVLTIGASGGRDVFIALTHGARHVDALEMDPSIVSLLTTPEMTEYMGGLYKNPRVNLVNDEGRSFLRRQPENSYDIIQFVNNYTPVAITSGALNLSETFLLTAESFKDMYAHLKPDGIIAIHRGTTLRTALTALQAMRELGIDHPEKQLIITNGEWHYFEGMFIKKGLWTEAEQGKIHAFLSSHSRYNNTTFLWTPFDPQRQNLYSEVISSPLDMQKKYYTSLGVTLSPATDDQPFLEHTLPFGAAALDSRLPPEFAYRANRKSFGRIPEGDFPYVAILLESAVLALLFVGFPLIMWGKISSVPRPTFLKLMTYFASLGFAFIVVEICLMKRYVLFLGSPAYSITTILVALLASAGLGSIVSSSVRPGKEIAAMKLIIPAIALLLIAEANLAPLIFAKALGFEFAGRVAVAAALIAPVGFFMGMPFSLGMRLINSLPCSEPEKKKLLAWAWGINGYATVIGSALSVFIALFFGFKIAFYIAVAVYLVGLLAVAAGMHKPAVAKI